ncbi:MAG: 23S rRNA (guanosine(2251)-2'-O)-methyltransferase RlmB [Chloroflexota bacterium]
MSERALLIWGRHPVLEALNARTVQRIVMARGRDAPSLEEIRSLARVEGIEIEIVPAADIERLAPGQNTQGVVAEVSERRVNSVQDLLDSIVGEAHLLVLDQIQDPHNLGALLRTADAAGIEGVIFPVRRSAPVSGVVAKTSAGAVSYVPIVEVPNLARALDEVRDAGIWAVGLDEGAPTSIFDAGLTGPLALVIGSEGRGLRRLTREHVDLLVRLPMEGHVASLNASVAGGIALYEALRQRLASGNAT